MCHTRMTLLRVLLYRALVSSRAICAGIYPLASQHDRSGQNRYWLSCKWSLLPPKSSCGNAAVTVTHNEYCPTRIGHKSRIKCELVLDPANDFVYYEVWTTCPEYMVRVRMKSLSTGCQGRMRDWDQLLEKNKSKHRLVSNKTPTSVTSLRPPRDRKSVV